MQSLGACDQVANVCLSMVDVDGAAPEGQGGDVSDPVRTIPSVPMLRWLSAHAGFPARRLPASAETLLCIADAAAGEALQPELSSASFGLQRREGNKDAAMRAHALRRSRVHFKCDNSAKV